MYTNTYTLITANDELVGTQILKITSSSSSLTTKTENYSQQTHNHAYKRRKFFYSHTHTHTEKHALCTNDFLSSIRRKI